ncbi:MAG: hypothetical protein ACJ71K_05495 [Nitrososphaeraceae archaeon]
MRTLLAVYTFSSLDLRLGKGWFGVVKIRACGYLSIRYFTMLFKLPFGLPSIILPFSMNVP